MLLPKRQPRFESRSQSWATPQELFDRLDGEFHFNVDLAASTENAKCRQFYSERDDAFQHEWQGVGWLNPPFNSPDVPLRRWVKRAYHAATKGATVVMLCPAHTNTNWWHDFCMRASEIRFLRGRPKFGDAKCGLVQSLAVVVFTPSMMFGTTQVSSYQA
jgi:phage N-6-adenine-methyltransferase